MLSILCSGTLIRDPQSRQGRNGRPFALASMRVPAEDSDAMLVSVIAFNADAVAALMALSRGDSCAIAGRGKLTSWEKDGAEKHGLSVIATQVMSVYAADKRRAKAQGAKTGTDAPESNYPVKGNGPEQQAKSGGGGRFADTEAGAPW